MPPGSVKLPTQKQAPPLPKQPPTDSSQTFGPGPVATLTQPVKAPTEKPQPALSNVGFQGGINEFNQRVQQVHDTFVSIHGYQPTPGLVLDIARSSVLPTQFSPLLQPTSATLAKNQQAVQNFHQNGFVTRPDGHMEPVNPVAPIARASAGFAELQKTHPWVAAGMLPVPNIDGLWKALAYLQNNPEQTKPLTEGGLTIQQYERENDIGAQPGKLGQPLSLMSDAIKGQNVAFGATTVKDAQQHLASIAPEYFGSLPQSGFINSDWAKAISQYTSSAQYFKQQTSQLASDNHFGSDTAGFVKAWKAKQSAIKKNPVVAQFLAAQPLAMFSDSPDAFRNYLTGNTKGLGWINVPTWGLNALTHTVGLAVTELGASYGQAKADAAAAQAYMQAITPKGWELYPGLGGQLFFNTPKGKGETEAQAIARAAKVLQDNPSWVRVFNPDWSGQSAIGQIANLGVDLMIGKPAFTGESVAAGDIGALKQSKYFNSKTVWAFNTLAAKGENGVAEAAHTLENGLGAEQLAAQTAAKIKAGEMSLPEFQQKAAELYAHGHTLDGAASGPLLKSLRGKGLPTPGKVGLTWQAAHAMVKDALDNWENTLLARKTNIGETSNAANMVSSVRQAFARAAPRGGQHLFEENLPGDIYNWTVKHVGNRKLADTLRNDFVNARAANDVPGMVAVNDRMRTAYLAAHPDAKVPDNPFAGSEGATLESEQRTYFRFPSTVEQGAHKINQTLNKLGARHRQVIVGGDLNPVVYPFIPGGGESLAWKHVAADTTRREVGGGGPLFGMTSKAKAGKAFTEQAMTDEPALARLIGVNRSQAILGEQRWITGSQVERVPNFTTGEHLADNAKMTAAGGYLRHRLTSNALKAYQQSTKGDLGPLVNLILKDKNYRAMMGSTQSYAEGMAKLRAAGPVAEGVVKAFNREQAQLYAESVFQSYKEIEDAGRAVNIQDPLSSALGVLTKNIGPAADKKLGKWIADNKIDFPVTDGLVENASRWDSTMSWWIGKLMTANKWNRGKLFDHVFYSTVKDLTDAGWEAPHAVAVAANLAKAQTVYHMLDFSNMLQVEQDLRWLSYFSTKHRLYWQWVGRQVVRHPGSGAVLADVSQHLDNKGNLQLHLFGRTLYIPVARLFWANSADYPQTSPIIQAAAETGKGIVEGHGVGQSVSDAIGSLSSTSGNVITRDDQAWMMAAKLAGIATGKIPASSDAVTFGMSPTSKQIFQEQVNQYSNLYHAEHGTWPSEPDAVKHVLLHETANTFWRANLPLPVTWDSAGAITPTVKKQLDTYGQILSPEKKRAYLDAHPAVALRFGISKDPAVYLHNAPLWDRFNASSNWLKQQRAAIWQTILKDGFTPQVKLQMAQLSATWSAKIDALKTQDAATWAGSPQFPAGQVSDGKVVTPGPWGVQLEGDPFAARAFIHQAFPAIPKSVLDAHTVGERIVALQGEAAQLRAAKTPAQIAGLGYQTAQQIRDRLSQINQVLSPYFAYPKDAPSAVQSEFYAKFVGPYITQRDKMTAQVALAPTDQQDALRSQLRAWKDQHDHPVTITYQGHTIKFPSVVQIGWATLPEDQKHLGLAQAVSGDWAHIASYEKTMLGVKTSADVSQGWSAYATAVRDYTKNPSNSNLVQAQKVGLAKQIDKAYPGFYKDFLFSLKPKVERFQNTDLYRQMPDKALFDQYVVGPAKQMIRAINQNGNRNYYTKAWRLYVEQKVTPWLDSQPTLKKSLGDYGPDFLNTLLAP